MSNSCVNGIIYSWMSPRFRDEVKIFLAKYCHISENFLVSLNPYKTICNPYDPYFMIKHNFQNNPRPSHSPTEVTEAPSPEAFKGGTQISERSGRVNVVASKTLTLQQL